MKSLNPVNPLIRSILFKSFILIKQKYEKYMKNQVFTLNRLNCLLKEY
jgi:hypothetical protein